MIIQLGRFVLFSVQNGRGAASDPRDREIEALRKSQDELADELADLQRALDERKVQILDLAEDDPAWEEIARAVWPEESENLFGKAPTYDGAGPDDEGVEVPG